MVGERRGEGGPHGPVDDGRVDRGIVEPAAGAARFEEVDGVAAGAEQVLTRRAHEVAGGAVPGRAGHAAQQRRRDPARLALDQVGGGGDLVGHGGLGDLQDAPVVVGAAAVIGDRAHPGQPDGRVGLAQPPGPPEGVGDHDHDVGPGQLAEPGPQGGGGGVGVGRGQDQAVAAGVGRVDEGVGANDAMPVLGDDQVAAPGDDPDGLGRDGGLRDGEPRLRVGGQLDQAALGLGHDLRGDGEHVAVGQREPGRLDPGEQERGQVVARPDLGQAGQRRDGDRPGCRMTGHSRSIAVLARAAASATVVMMVWVTTASSPRASTAAACPASTWSST